MPRSHSLTNSSSSGSSPALATDDADPRPARPASLMAGGFAPVTDHPLLAIPAPLALTISTPHGATHGRWRPGRSNRAAVALLPGADGALGGPASLFDDLAEELRGRVAVAQFGYRHPGALDTCRDDILAALAGLSRQGVERVALIGWDFGAAVAAAVSARSPHVTGVALLAPDAAAISAIAAIPPDQLLLIHGAGDTGAPSERALPLSALAGERADVAIYPGESHDFTQRARTREALLSLLTRWTATLLATPFRSGPRRPDLWPAAAMR